MSEPIKLRLFEDPSSAFVELINQLVQQYKAGELRIVSAGIVNENGKKTLRIVYEEVKKVQ